MSQQQWAGQARSPGGGSVRRARERVEAGLPPEITQPPQQRPYEPPRAAPGPPQNRVRPQMPPALQGSRNGQGPIGVAISRPTQVPQWPLAGTIEGTPEQSYQPPAGRREPPQRPPRPSHVPSMLDASRLQEHTPAFQYKPTQNPPEQQGRGRFQEEDVTSPSVTSPLTQSSRPSTTSSVGTIPDFPLPMPAPVPQGQPRRSANLGPPPTARRGASSYYSHASYVSPILEESPRTQPSHGSYASSAAMPSSWGEESPGYRYEDEDDDRERGFGHEVIEEGRESRESNGDDNEDRGLIRSASLGKRAKPSMVTTRSSDKIDPRMDSGRPAPQPQQRSKLERMGIIDGAAAGALAGASLTASRARGDGQRETVWPMIGNPDSPLAGGTGFIDKSTSSSETSVPQVARAVTTNDKEAAPTDTKTPSDPKANAMLGAYNAASSLQPGQGPSRTPSPGQGFSRLSAIRRPPRLDIDAVRDAEARGSLTSLPDLIRRATKLAAMMDRGKRPASRLNNLNDFPSDSDLARDKEMGLSSGSDEKRQSGLSGMLAAFPPPGLATPTRDSPGTPRPISSWPSPYPPGQDPRDPRSQPPRKRRRCCGLPCWGFFLVLVILAIIIAAAVVVPLELLVFHKPKSAASTAPTALQLCEQNNSTACQNGGTSLIATSTSGCSCICINGFTGSTCSVSGGNGCTTTTLSTSPSYTNVTLGEAIPRLIADAQTNFSIPLFETVILARFNSASLSCVSENALVTFDGLSSRVGKANDVVTPTSTSDSSSGTSSPNSNKRRNKRESSTSTETANGSAATANGIVYDPSSAYTSSDSTPSSTSSSAASLASASPFASFSVTEEVLDFARVAVLFVLQQEEIDAAVSAQSALQKFFSGTGQGFTNQAAGNVSLGGGNTVDLLDFAVDLGNGSVGAANSSVEKRTLNGRSIPLLETGH